MTMNVELSSLNTLQQGWVFAVGVVYFVVGFFCFCFYISDYQFINIRQPLYNYYIHKENVNEAILPVTLLLFYLGHQL